MDIPEFHGHLQLEEFLDWLSATKKLFEYKEVPDDLKVKLVATRLRGYASIWWDQVQEVRIHRGKQKVVEWEKMKMHLQDNFLPTNFAQT